MPQLDDSKQEWDEHLSIASEIPWFAELRGGTGSAAKLQAELRQIVILATVDQALDLSLKARQRRKESVAAEAAAQRELADVERAREHERRWLSAVRRRHTDWIVLGVALISCITVLVPWLIGRHVLRDAWFHPADPAVFDTEARSDSEYFLTDWLGGCFIVLLLAASIVLLGRWRYRWMSVTSALVIGIASIAAIYPASAAEWADAEATTSIALTTTSFPFSERFASCGSEVFDVADSEGESHHYQVHTAYAKSSGACNRLETFDGWKRIATFTLPDGETIANSESIIGTTTADSGIMMNTSTGDVVGLVLSTPEVVWRAAEAAPAELMSPNLAVSARGIGSPGAYLEAFNPITGASNWTARCPDTADYITSPPSPPSMHGVIKIRCQGPSGFGDTGLRYYGVDEAGIIRPCKSDC